ncbi:MAG: WG repeat-containing protein [Bacteroidales bacterium]|nr:WG repeat-containing protein [Bacteroidales bacterium]
MKKLRFLSLLAVLATTSTLFSQTYVTRVKPVGKDMWGIAGVDGALIINALFYRCSQISGEGIATVYDEAKGIYYLIDLQGNTTPIELSDFKLMSIYYINMPKGFTNGLVPVRQGKKWGYINTSGKVAIPVKYDKVTEFNGGFATAETGGKFIVLDSEGEEFPVNDPAVIDLKSFTENLAPYRSSNGKFGFIKETGEIAIPAQFTAVGYFSGGLAWARTADEKMGYINTNGDWIIQPRFEVAKSYDAETDRARIRLEGKMGFVNSKGDILYIVAEDFGDFSNGLCWGRKGNRIGFFNRDGEWKISPQFEAVRNFKNGFAAAKINDRWGLIDLEGKWVMEPSFAGITDVDRVE